MADATLPTTRVTLLTQLRQDPSDQAGWDEFVERYGRHIYRWCRQWKLQDADAEDVTQDILVKLTQKLRAFAYDPSRSFRGWLKTVAHHAWRDFDDSRRHARRAAGDSQVQDLRNPASATAAPWSWRRISSVSSATSPSGRDPSRRSEKLWRWVRRHPAPAGLLAAGLLAPAVALITLSLLSARLVRSNALESAAQQAELLEEATKEYSRNVQRVEKASFTVNKTVPPTPGTVPLSIPATFLHDVGQQLSLTGRTGVRVRQYSDYPFPWRTDGGPRDEFEREALRRLRQSKGQETVHEFTEVGGRRVVRYAQARVMERSCVECHSTHDQSPRKDWQVGDVRGVLEIIRPLDKDEARVSEALRLALLLSAVVSGLLLGGSMLVVWAGRRRTQVGS